MHRPVSITWFERCYLGAYAIGLLNTLAAWDATTALMMDNPAVAQLGSGFATSILAGGVAIGAVVTALLWFFAARRAAVVAKWIVVVFYALQIVGLLINLATGHLAQGAPGVVTIVVTVLGGIAVWMLFQPDSRAWFGEVDASGDVI